tara:strand:+ start:23264 stop:24415 length:1152 start_codon:yes stop_codon:yes gene_type:complete
MEPIYLDNAATTPIRDEVRDVMLPLLQKDFGNPSSSHIWGRRASSLLEEARERVANSLGAQRSEIYFVRGGTESDNLAILGRAEAVRAKGESPHVVITAIEHSAILEASARVIEQGGRCTILPVLPEGSIDSESLETALLDEPSVVSVMTVNNEIGIHLPVEEIAERTHAHGLIFHTDAIQAIGKVPVCLDTVPIDLLSLTGHKIYGAKGTGVLFVREGVEVLPIIFGGRQEHTLRPGTEDVAGAVGTSVAVDLAVSEQELESRRLESLRDKLQVHLKNRIDKIRVHGETSRRAPHILNVGIPGVDPQILLAGLDMEGIAVSAGSACESGSTKSSHVLEALYGEIKEMAALRFSLGRSTTDNDIVRAAEATVSVVTSIRNRDL